MVDEDHPTMVSDSTVKRNARSSILLSLSPPGMLVRWQVLAENGEVPQLALRLYLHCALAADAARLEPITYEFFTQAFVVYEEQLSDSRRQVTALSLLIGTLEQCKCISSENREALVHKCAGYSSRLLKKPDQCRAAYACR
jgi:hypothetical protein